MSHSFVKDLNEMGFQYRGEIMTVTAVREFTDTVESTRMRNGRPVPWEENVRKLQLFFASGGSTSMKREHVRTMLEHWRRRSE